MTNNLKIKKIILISKLKAKGINDNILFNKILKGNKRTLMLINNKYRKDLSQNYIHIINQIIKNKTFKRSFYDFQKSCIFTLLDSILRKEFKNNKSNIKFQKFLAKIDKELSESKYKALNNDLRIELNRNYKITIEKTINKVKYEENRKTIEKINRISELIDLIDYYNFSFENKSKILNIRSQMNNKQRKIKIMNLVKEYIKDNPTLKPILKKLNLNKGIVNNKLLYNQIRKEITDYKNKLYLMQFGINYSDKTDRKDNYYLSALPFELSGKFTSDNKNIDEGNYMDLGYNIFYCSVNPKSLKETCENNKLGYKYWINYCNNNSDISIIDSGKNFNSKLPSRYIIYKYNYDALKIDRIYLKVLKHISKKPNNFDNFTQMTDINLDFDYLNRENKFIDYKRIYDKNNKNNIKSYKIFYPDYKNERFLYSSFSHFCQKEISKEIITENGKLVRIKELKKTLGNLKPTNIYRENMNKHIRLILEYFDRTTDIKNFWKLNKSQFNIILRKLLNELRDQQITIDYVIDFCKDIKTKITKRINIIKTKYIRFTKLQLKNLTEYKKINKIHFNTIEGKKLKKKINKLTEDLNLFNITIHKLQNSLKQIVNFIDNFQKGRIRINKTISDLFLKQIQKFYETTLVRLINSQRTRKECIKLGLNNITWDIREIRFIKKELIEITKNFDNKFDELLNNDKDYEEIEEDYTISFDVIDFFKAIINIFDHTSKNDLIIYPLIDKIIPFIENIANKNINKEILILNTC